MSRSLAHSPFTPSTTHDDIMRVEEVGSSRPRKYGDISHIHNQAPGPTFPSSLQRHSGRSSLAEKQPNLGSEVVDLTLSPDSPETPTLPSAPFRTNHQSGTRSASDSSYVRPRHGVLPTPPPSSPLVPLTSSDLSVRIVSGPAALPQRSSHHLYPDPYNAHQSPTDATPPSSYQTSHSADFEIIQNQDGSSDSPLGATNVPSLVDEVKAFRAAIDKQQLRMDNLQTFLDRKTRQSELQADQLSEIISSMKDTNNRLGELTEEVAQLRRDKMSLQEMLGSTAKSFNDLKELLDSISIEGREERLEITRILRGRYGLHAVHPRYPNLGHVGSPEEHTERLSRNGTGGPHGDSSASDDSRITSPRPSDDSDISIGRRKCVALPQTPRSRTRSLGALGLEIEPVAAPTSPISPFSYTSYVPAHLRRSRAEKRKEEDSPNLTEVFFTPPLRPEEFSFFLAETQDHQRDKERAEGSGQMQDTELRSFHESQYSSASKSRSIRLSPPAHSPSSAAIRSIVSPTTSHAALGLRSYISHEDGVDRDSTEDELSDSPLLDDVEPLPQGDVGTPTPEMTASLQLRSSFDSSTRHLYTRSISDSSIAYGKGAARSAPARPHSSGARLVDQGDLEALAPRTLRKRKHSPDYINHPMDSEYKKQKRREKLRHRSVSSPLGDRVDQSQSGKSGAPESSIGSASAQVSISLGSIRSPSSVTDLRVSSSPVLRGTSLGPERTILSASDGKKSEIGAEWPKRGPNTVKGRMQEISCDDCHGRAHWACAGFNDNSKMTKEAWSCPDCIVIRDAVLEDESMPPFEQSQQERCLRPNCILRSREKLIRKQDDEEEYFFERIIGQRSTGRRGVSQRVYEYLVKWDNWPVWDCTCDHREPAKSIPDFKVAQAQFLEDTKAADVDTRWGCALLPEAMEWFDEEGEIKLEKAVAEGLEPRPWWS